MDCVVFKKVLTSKYSSRADFLGQVRESYEVVTEKSSGLNVFEIVEARNSPNTLDIYKFYLEIRLII